LLIGTHQIIAQLFQAFFFVNLANIPELVRLGKLDSVLVLPIDSQFAVSTKQFGLDSIINALLGAGVVIFSLSKLSVVPNALSVLLYVVALGFGVAVHYSIMLALAAARLQSKLSLRSVAATVMQPASEGGPLAMDELHQQTVNLLSFQTLPREQYDAQVAFNLLPSLGEAAKVKLGAAENRIREHYAAISGGSLPPLALQVMQAPVFHGYVVSMLVEVAGAATVEQVEAALAGDHFDVVNGESDPPSNLSAAGQEDIMVRVREEVGGDGMTRFWLWLAADNLKLAALNAIACATELSRFRPMGKVQ